MAKTKLPLSIGILAWHSGETLVRTLKSYQRNGLLDAVSDIRILFQEASEEDRKIAQQFAIPGIFLEQNIGLGKGFSHLAKAADCENVLLLEHDWKLIENADFTYQRLAESLALIGSGTDCVRLRHRRRFGYPHMAVNQFRKRPADYVDDWILLGYSHLLESIHWRESPELDWPGKIEKVNDYFKTLSCHGCFTNNPCIYRKDFYLKNVAPFAGDGISNEENISYWWARQHFKIAQGEGLFEHDDRKKYGHPLVHSMKALGNQLNPFSRNLW
jgi:hypothetical protein